MLTKLILVGGFLGAGKTTLLAEASRRLSLAGKRVGLITNDQAPDLVDTALLTRVNAQIAEVSGSCFCCNFPGFLDATQRLSRDNATDVLIAEPVGSCTDLNATIIQPLRELHGNRLAVCPLSVLVDPSRLESILGGGSGALHPSAAYIFRKQMEEADTIVLTKVDRLDRAKRLRLESDVRKQFPLADVVAVSAKTGDGVDEWLEAVLTREDAGRNLAEVDYDTYAEGEAVLGWLNASYLLSGDSVDWRGLAHEILSRLAERFDREEAAVGHIKVICEADDAYVVGNVTGARSTLNVRGPGFSSPEAKLTLNARVEMSPEEVSRAVHDTLASVCGEQIRVREVAHKCLRPGRPTPTYRYDHLVNLAG